jgi:hypothetical protein
VEKLRAGWHAGGVQKLPEKTLAAIGRMTVAAVDLEHLLAWIGADRAGGDAAAVFARPGEALIAARGSVEFAGEAVRGQLITAVEAAGTQLAISQSALRKLWRDDTPADPAVFDGIAVRLLRTREWLQNVVEEHLDTTVG